MCWCWSWPLVAEVPLSEVSPILFFANSILMPPLSEEKRTYPWRAFIVFAAYRTSCESWSSWWPWFWERQEKERKLIEWAIFACFLGRSQCKRSGTHRVLDKSDRSSSLTMHPESTETREAACCHCVSSLRRRQEEDTRVTSCEDGI